MVFFTLEYVALLVLALSASAPGQSYNPTILQDSRDLPKTDGRFGFLYRTEDGIAHAAKSEGDGVIHGRYTYTDSTGFKLNFNYNAGTKVTPGYNYDQQIQQPQRPQQAYYPRDDEGYQEQRAKPPASRRNDLYDDYSYRE